MAENLLLCVLRERERESEIREKAARLKEVNPKVSIYERFSKRDLVISIKGEGGGEGSSSIRNYPTVHQQGEYEHFPPPLRFYPLRHRFRIRHRI